LLNLLDNHVAMHLLAFRRGPAGSEDTLVGSMEATSSLEEPPSESVITALSELTEDSQLGPELSGAGDDDAVS
jgi:hypothetical protein